jgi:hypothetical protein
VLRSLCFHDFSTTTFKNKVWKNSNDFMEICIACVCVYEFNSKRGGKWAVASAFREKEAITKISHVIIFIIIELFVCFKNVLNKIRFTHYS